MIGVKHVGALAGGGLVSVVAAPVARADDLTPTDSHGISILDYPMSFNEGAGKAFGLVVTPTVTATASFAMLAFGFFIGLAWLTFSVFKLFVRLDWIPPLVEVAQRVSESITTQMGRPFLFSIVGGTLLLTVVIFGLRNHAGRAWHHVAITLVCLGVGVIITLPVGEAAHLLKMGRDAAASTGAVVTPQTSTDTTALLIDKFVRQPTQRWQFGQDLDSLGCGQAWDSAVSAIRTGSMDVARIKDVPLACPGGATGQSMHAFAMNPSGAVWLSFLNPLFMLLVGLLVAVVVGMIAATAVSAIIHAALIKPGLITVGTPWGQSFLARNIIDGYTAALQTCGLLLLLIIGGSVSGLVALSVPSSQVGMLITLVILVAFIVGTRRVGRNLRVLKNSAARSVLPHGAPNAYGPPSKAPAHARRLATEAARQIAAKRRSAALLRGVSRAAARSAVPQMMIPAHAAGVMVQHVMAAAAQYYQTQPGPWGGPRTEKRPASAATRSLNYSHGPTGGGGSSAATRAMARRATERRHTAAAAAAAAGPAGRPASGRPSGSRPAPVMPAAAAPLRTNTTARAATEHHTVGVTPRGAAPARASVGVPAGAPGPTRITGPAGPGSPVSAGSPQRSRTTTAAAGGSERRGVPAGMRRSGVIQTARDAARGFRNRR